MIGWKLSKKKVGSNRAGRLPKRPLIPYVNLSFSGNLHLEPLYLNAIWRKLWGCPAHRCAKLCDCSRSKGWLSIQPHVDHELRTRHLKSCLSIYRFLGRLKGLPVKPPALKPRIPKLHISSSWGLIC